jgi:hypothetical protein
MLLGITFGTLALLALVGAASAWIDRSADE